MKEKWGKLLLGLVFAVGLLCYGAPVPAVTLNVCKSSCTYSTIQSAINAASDGDTVLVDNGVYTENINFNGLAITVKSVNGAEYTTIDGNQSGSVVTFNSGEGAESVLDGFTITNGNGTVSGSYTYGGGIYCWQSSPTITNCTINSNSANEGSGVSCYYSSPMITKCTISNNTADRTGGGVLCEISSPTLINCLINGNMANWGGGVCCSGSLPIITNCTISNNGASSSGGGIFCDGSSLPIVVNTIFWGNRAGEVGDEIYLSSGGYINITYSDIQGGDPDNPGSPYPGTGNIDADPLFHANYHLTAGSPCIDSGTDDTVTYPSLPGDDIDGDTRPQDGNGDSIAQYDMGADEYIAQTPAGTISGFVTETSYFPIAHARVNLIKGGTLLDFTFTNPYGHYEFTSLADGTYIVVAGKPGYGRDRKPGKVQQAVPWGREEFVNLVLTP
jgi:hypothetical protein